MISTIGSISVRAQTVNEQIFSRESFGPQADISHPAEDALREKLAKIVLDIADCLAKEDFMTAAAHKHDKEKVLADLKSMLTSGGEQQRPNFVALPTNKGDAWAEL
jgi:hypothetical protein